MCRKVNQNRKGAFYSLSVFILVAVVIALAVIVIAIFTGLFSGTEQNNIPYVSIKQETGFVLITSIQNGPVVTSDCYAHILNKNTGQIDGNATINDGNDGELNIGDSISINDISQGSYSVEIVYRDNVVGICQFNVYTAQ